VIGVVAVATSAAPTSSQHVRSRTRDSSHRRRPRTVVPVIDLASTVVAVAERVLRDQLVFVQRRTPLGQRRRMSLDLDVMRTVGGWSGER
jgi:hypothetical protein